MRKALLTTLVVVASIAGLGCEEEVKPSKVVGSLQFSGQQVSGDFTNIDGTLAEGGAKYFGYCDKNGDNFEFVVATKDRAKASNATDFYLLVRGVVGPPVEGVNDASGLPKDDSANYTSFESILLNKVLDEMQNTIGDWGFEKDGPFRQVKGIFYMFLGRDIANNGGIGLWKNIYEFLTSADHTNTAEKSLDTDL